MRNSGLLSDQELSLTPNLTLFIWTRQVYWLVLAKTEAAAPALHWSSMKRSSGVQV